VAQFQQVAGHLAGAGHVVAFHVVELGAEGGALAQDDGGRLPLPQDLIDGSRGRQTVNGKDQQPVHAPGYQPADAGFLALWIVECVGQDQIVAPFVRAFFDGRNRAGEDGVGDGGQDQTEQTAFAAAQSLGHGIGDVAHLLGQKPDARPGLGGDIGGVAQGLGSRHQ
jgi:hypothetical protein